MHADARQLARNDTRTDSACDRRDGDHQFPSRHSQFSSSLQNDCERSRRTSGSSIRARPRWSARNAGFIAAWTVRVNATSASEPTLVNGTSATIANVQNTWSLTRNGAAAMNSVRGASRARDATYGVRVTTDHDEAHRSPTAITTPDTTPIAMSVSATVLTIEHAPCAQSITWRRSIDRIAIAQTMPAAAPPSSSTNNRDVSRFQRSTNCGAASRSTWSATTASAAPPAAMPAPDSRRTESPSSCSRADSDAARRSIDAATNPTAATYGTRVNSI